MGKLRQGLRDMQGTSMSTVGLEAPDKKGLAESRLSAKRGHGCSWALAPREQSWQNLENRAGGQRHRPGQSRVEVSHREGVETRALPAGPPALGCGPPKPSG